MSRRQKYFVQDRAWRHRRRGRSWRPSLRKRGSDLRVRLRRRRSERKISFASSRRAILIAAAGACVLGLPFLYIWQGTKIQELTARREAAREELTQIEEINHALELRIEQGFSLNALSRFAADHGMVTPAKVTYVRVPKS